ncbi:MAG: hypothetical protein M0Z82_05480 [Actinomycetota bacterium]|jgi:hypothetical protein|nr:hypothetical protein [Actinomycetota bacterium]
MTMPQSARITRRDIEEKIRSLTSEAAEEVATAKPTLIGSGVAVALVVVALAYLLGRRSGRKRSAVVEIRRL